MPRRPHGVHPRRREADARASFGPISAHKYLEATERARAITPLNDNSREVTAVASFSAERELNACYIRAVRHNALMPSTGASAKNP